VNSALAAEPPMHGDAYPVPTAVAPNGWICAPVTNPAGLRLGRGHRPRAGIRPRRFAGRPVWSAADWLAEEPHLATRPRTATL
jgi:hypothetical protein